MVDQVHAYRGPQCARFGPGTGGVLDFSTTSAPLFGKYGGTVGLSVGSFGYQRAAIALGANAFGGQQGVSALYVHERFAGYRAQEGNHKDFVHIKAFKRLERGGHATILRASMWYYDGGWELPGALDSLTSVEAPQSANPYSQQQAQAAVRRQWLQVNLGFSTEGEKWLINSNVYGQATHKLNPYGTSAFSNGYKDETGNSWGTRTRFAYHAISQTLLTLDIECQVEPAHLLEYDNILGQPGTLRIDQQVTGGVGLVSLGASRVFPDAMLTCNFGLNYLATDFQDKLQPLPKIRIATPWVPQGSFEARIRPRKWNTASLKSLPDIILRAASAYSPPNWWELRQENGSIDQNLKHEQGFNFEAGLQFKLKGNPQNGVEIRAYHLALWGAILPYTDTLGLTRYRNAEQCGQSGVELSLHHHLTKAWQIQGSAAWMHYRFTEASRVGDFEKGDAVPGIPPITGFLATEYELPFHLLLRVSGQFTGSIWLDSRNTDRQDAYVVVNAFAEQILTRKRKGLQETRASLRLTGGVTNMLNAAYSNYLNLNDRRRNYWNPAPTRNIFAGLQCTF
jgi:iron complex outermembrane receptor protein